MVESYLEAGLKIRPMVDLKVGDIACMPAPTPPDAI